jgi:hypothetical protein
MSVTHTDTVTWNGQAFDEISANDAGRPVLFTNARVLTMDPLIGNLVGADVLLVGALLVGALLVGVGPGIITAAQDDDAIVVDCTGMTVVPAVVDTVALVGGRGRRSEYVATLTPGNTGDLLVVPDESPRTWRARRPRCSPGRNRYAPSWPTASRSSGRAPTPPAAPPRPRRASRTPRI